MKNKNSGLIDERDIKTVWKLIRKNWYIFIILIGLSAIISNFIIHKTTSIYSVSTTLLLNSNTESTLQNSILKGLGVTPPNENIDNEIRIISSRSLVENALTRLKLENSYFIEGRLKTSEIYNTELRHALPFWVEANLKNSELYGVDFYIDIIDKNTFKLKYNTKSEKIEHKYSFGKAIDNKDFFLRVIKNDDRSYPGAEETNYFFNINQKNTLSNKYKGNLSVKKFGGSTGYVEVSILDELPDRGIDFLDTLTKIYLDNSMIYQYQINEKSSLFINNLLSEVVGKLNSMEGNLEEFKKMNISLTNKQTEYLTQLQNLSAQKTLLEMKLNSLNYLYDYITKNKEFDNLPTIGNDDSYISNYVSSLNELLANKSELLLKGTSSTFSAVLLDNRIQLLKTNLMSYLQININSTPERIKILSSQIKKFEELIATFPKPDRDLINIQRQVEVNEKIYTYLLEKKADNVIAKATIIPTKSVIELPRSSGIVKPDKNKLMLTSIGIGLIISFILVFLRKILFETIDDKEDLKQLTDIPLYGIVGKNKESKDDTLVVEEKPKSAIAESFRAIRINFEYLAPEIEHKVVLVTSYLANEGKTFCSSNLAAIIARTGKKVLLIGLDLHKPQLHNVFKLSNHIGITSFLIGKTTLDDTIKKTSVPNLDILLSGSIPPNASELIFSNQLKELIKDLRKTYDFIIIDTPPLGLVSDALMLFREADINLFIIRAGFAKKQFVDFANEIKEQNNLQNFGIILNDVSKANITYGYNYGYGKYGNAYYS